jgi:hypothetical protein
MVIRAPPEATACGVGVTGGVGTGGVLLATGVEAAAGVTDGVAEAEVNGGVTPPAEFDAPPLQATAANTLTASETIFKGRGIIALT